MKLKPGMDVEIFKDVFMKRGSRGFVILLQKLKIERYGKIVMEVWRVRRRTEDTFVCCIRR
jgi:hypothetical protein